MNWMGGSRNRIKAAEEKKRQQEYFEKFHQQNNNQQQQYKKSSAAANMSQDLKNITLLSQMANTKPGKLTYTQ